LFIGLSDPGKSSLAANIAEAITIAGPSLVATASVGAMGIRKRMWKGCENIKLNSARKLIVLSNKIRITTDQGLRSSKSENSRTVAAPGATQSPLSRSQ
jgi:hypothetical protein